MGRDGGGGGGSGGDGDGDDDDDDDDDADDDDGLQIYPFNLLNSSGSVEHMQPHIL